MACAKCGGPLRVLAVITEREPIRHILAHLGLPADPPPLARARDPDDDLDRDESSGQLGLACGPGPWSMPPATATHAPCKYDDAPFWA
ncbi:MAG: hypothetical protein ACLQVI_04930 [Polyangiaceae bacterium]